jgi:hypothetical protein
MGKLKNNKANFLIKNVQIAKKIKIIIKILKIAKNSNYLKK